MTQDNAFNLTLSGQEAGASVAYQVSLNGGAFTATTASQSGLADGDYQFRALVTDAAGNTSTSNVIRWWWTIRHRRKRWRSLPLPLTLARSATSSPATPR